MDTLYTLLQNEEIRLYAVVIAGVIFILLLVLMLGYKNALRKQKITLGEYKEKVKYLRQINAENEHRHSTFTHETEKTIIGLEHTIETLELKVKEGTKNQVVSMLETQQNKRAKQLERAGLNG